MESSRYQVRDHLTDRRIGTSAVNIEHAQLLFDTTSQAALLRLQLQNVSSQPISQITIRYIAYDVNGVLTETNNYTASLNSVGSGQSFELNDPIPLQMHRLPSLKHWSLAWLLQTERSGTQQKQKSQLPLHPQVHDSSRLRPHNSKPLTHNNKIRIHSSKVLTCSNKIPTHSSKVPTCSNKIPIPSSKILTCSK